jgi:phosphatidylglycerophosphate synthase
MVRVDKGLALGSVVLVALLVALATTVGLAASGWSVALACGVAIGVAVARTAIETFGPADLVTLGRAVLGCALAALVADSFFGEPATAVIVGLAVVALVTDAVDGRVARATGTISAFGARLDGEVDAFLILVLSVYVAAEVQGWVLAIGLARYLFAAAGWVWLWMRSQLPPRHWRKWVTAVQGIVLTAAAAAVLPDWLDILTLLVAAALLAESFGRDVVWLWRRRPSGPGRRAGDASARLHLPGP